jgi:hypothetical protein
MSPDSHLLDGGGAKGVGGHDKRFATLLLQPVSKFACGGGLAGSIDAIDEDYGGASCFYLAPLPDPLPCGEREYSAWLC